MVPEIPLKIGNCKNNLAASFIRSIDRILSGGDDDNFSVS